MTEQEAKTKWCPMVQGGNFRGYIGMNVESEPVCIGSACMMWRWNPEAEGMTATYVDNSRRLGYCGLAGKP